MKRKALVEVFFRLQKSRFFFTCFVIVIVLLMSFTFVCWSVANAASTIAHSIPAYNKGTLNAAKQSKKTTKIFKKTNTNDKQNCSNLGKRCLFCTRSLSKRSVYTALCTKTLHCPCWTLPNKTSS